MDPVKWGVPTIPPMRQLDKTVLVRVLDMVPDTTALR